MPQCEFTFGRDPPVYVCGETLTGNVALVLFKERSVEDIRIDFCGKATVSWVDTMARFPKLYSAEETYMELETIVFQGGQMKADTYTYTFSFHIPDTCPTTCTTDIGRIFYELVLKLTFSDKTEARKFTSDILVLQVFDVDKVPNALLPVVRNDEITYCCWPCSAGPIEIHLQVERSAYTPGDTINFSIVVSNMSKRCKFRTRITAYFMQIYKFTTQTPRRRTRYISYILSTVENSFIVNTAGVASVDDEFFVPPLPPSTQGTHIISIKYELRLQTRLSNIAQEMSDVTLPILIGTSADITPDDTKVKPKSRHWS